MTIDAIKFRDRWEAYRIEAMKSDATHERVMLQGFLLYHADALLALVDQTAGWKYENSEWIIDEDWCPPDSPYVPGSRNKVRKIGEQP